VWLLSEKKKDASMFSLSEILSKISTQTSEITITHHKRVLSVWIPCQALYISADRPRIARMRRRPYILLQSLLTLKPLDS